MPPSATAFTARLQRQLAVMFSADLCLPAHCSLHLQKRETASKYLQKICRVALSSTQLHSEYMAGRLGQIKTPRNRVTNAGTFIKDSSPATLQRRQPGLPQTELLQPFQPKGPPQGPPASSAAVLWHSMCWYRQKLQLAQKI